jgi:hypothetical protein
MRVSDRKKSPDRGVEVEIRAVSGKWTYASGESRAIVVRSPGADTMLDLVFPGNLTSLPTAKCSKHGLSISPVVTQAPEKLTVVWECPACEAEDKANNAQLNTSPFGAKRTIKLE